MGRVKCKGLDVRALKIGWVLAAALLGATQTQAHSLDGLKQDMFDRELYFPIKDAPAPDFSLRGANDTPVRLHDLLGKVVVLNFIYTNCPDYCPLHAEKIAEVQQMINMTPMRDQVQFVSVTTDPARDTPNVLRTYGQLHGLDPVNWVFATSTIAEPEDATRTVAKSFGLEFTPDENGVMQMHGLVTIVIDREGRWRGNFHGLDFESTNLVLYVNALVNDLDTHPPGGEPPSDSSFWSWVRSWF